MAVPRRESGEKISGGRRPSISPRRHADETLRGSADQHHVEVAGKEHDSVLKVGHHLVQVFLQGGEDFFHVAHLPAQAFNLSGDCAVFIGAFCRRFCQLRLSGADQIRRRLIAASGRRAKLESPAARMREMKMAPPESSMAFFNNGWISFFRKSVETPTRTSRRPGRRRARGTRMS